MPRVGTINLTKEQEKRTFHLPIEQAVFVPSTSGVKTQTRISPARLNKRVNNVRRFLSNKFGGFTSVKSTGGFVLKKSGRLVKERVIKVTAFSSKDDFKEHKPALIKQIGTWGKKWKQEAVGYSNEGDFFSIEPPKNGKPRVIKRVVRRRLVKVPTPVTRKRRATPEQLRNLAKARSVRRRKR